MSAQQVVAAEDQAAACWCCGNTDDADRMVHLGNHPEVHLCLRCAHFVHQQAWHIEDGDKSGPPAVARARFRSLRGEVVRRDLHRNRFIGGMLRWLGKHLP